MPFATSTGGREMTSMRFTIFPTEFDWVKAKSEGELRIGESTVVFVVGDQKESSAVGLLLTTRSRL